MSSGHKCEQLDQCSVCFMWVDFNAGPEFAACPACPFREDFIAQAKGRRRDNSIDAAMRADKTTLLRTFRALAKGS